MPIELSFGDRIETFDKKVIIIGNSGFADFNVPLEALTEEHIRIRFVSNDDGWLVENLTEDENIWFNNEKLPNKILFTGLGRLVFGQQRHLIRLRVINNAQETNIKKISSKIDNETGILKELEKRKALLNNRRIDIVSKIWSKINLLRSKIFSNYFKYTLLMILMFILSVIMAFGVANLLLGIYPITGPNEVITGLQFNLWWWIALTIIVFSLTILLEEGIFRTFIGAKDVNTPKASYLVGSFMSWISVSLIAVIFLANLLYYHQIDITNWTFPLILSLSFTLVMYVSSVIAGYLHYEMYHQTEELYYKESDEQLGNLVHDYDNWIKCTLKSLNHRQIEGIRLKVRDIAFMRNLKYFFALITAPFVSFGASNTVASFFPDAGIIRTVGLRFNPIIWSVLTIAVVIAFILLTKGLVKSKEIQGSNVIINDGYSNSEVHGISVTGAESQRMSRKQRLYYFLGAGSILLIEISTNLVYFIQTQGEEAFFVALMIALIPTILLISEAVAVSNDIYQAHIQQTILENAGKRATLL